MRAPKKYFFILTSVILLLAQGFSFIPSYARLIDVNPVTLYAYDGLPLAEPFEINFPFEVLQTEAYASKTLPVLDFAQSLVDGNSGVIRGLYVEEKFAYPVIQQPSGNAGFVSTASEVVTDFAMARKYGVTGLLAHNYLAGADFFALQVGDIVQVVYGDGVIQRYQITTISSFQALSPRSASSNFIDLQTSEQLTATELFKRVYMGSHHLTLQTCIQQGTEDSWGRLFIIAQPI